MVQAVQSPSPRFKTVVFLAYLQARVFMLPSMLFRIPEKAAPEVPLLQQSIKISVGGAKPGKHFPRVLVSSACASFIRACILLRVYS